MSVTATGGPTRATKRQLAKVGVELINADFSGECLRCIGCGQRWGVNLLAGGLLSRGYWKCPNGCQTEYVPVNVGDRTVNVRTTTTNPRPRTVTVKVREVGTL